MDRLLVGKTISGTSRLSEISILEDARFKLELYSNFELYIGDDKIEHWDMIEEIEAYFTSIIRNQRIEYLTYNRRGRLELVVDSDPVVRIKLDPETMGTGYESWNLNMKDHWAVY